MSISIENINKEVRIRAAIKQLHKLKAVTPYQLERELNLGSNAIYFTVNQNRPLPQKYIERIETWLAAIKEATQDFEPQPSILQNPAYRDFLEAGGVIP